MRVEARAVIIIEGKVVTTIETRRGEPHSALPGGGVERWESVEDALIREVEEETGLMIVPGRLLYVAQVVSRFALHDLDLIFAATTEDHSSGHFQLLDPAGGQHILPPVLERIAADASLGWPESPRWLGNIFRNPRDQGQESQTTEPSSAAPPDPL